MEWPATFLDIFPLNNIFGPNLKTMVYQVKIRDINHLKEGVTNAISSITSEVLMHFYQQ